jgi:hypothetical protein
MEFPNPGLQKRQQEIKQFYVKYQEVIVFNKNIIIAAIASIIADAAVVHYSAEAISNDILVSLISIITDTGVYLSAFACMFYIDNRKKYIDIVTGKRDSSRFKHDAKRIVTALGVSELVYIITKFISIYLLLQTNAASPYQVAMLTTLVAWVFYIIAANLMVRVQKLF